MSSTVGQTEAGYLSLADCLAISPFARFLNIQPRIDADCVVLKLCFAEHHIGNPMIRALHGGIVASLCELSASTLLAFRTRATSMPRTLSHNISYLRSTIAADCYAQASVERIGRRTATLSARAWQEDVENPVAISRLTFRTKGVFDVSDRNPPD